MADPKHPHETTAMRKRRKAVKRASRQRKCARVKAARDAAPVAVPTRDIVGTPIFTIPTVEKLGFFAMLGAFLGIKRSKKERRKDPKGDKPL